MGVLNCFSLQAQNLNQSLTKAITTFCTRTLFLEASVIVIKKKKKIELFCM